MSFTTQDIIDVSEIYTNVSIDSGNAVHIINQGLNRLSTLGYVFDIEHFTILTEDEEVFQTFTNDILGVVLVLDENEKLYNRWKYDKTNGIKFFDEGEYKVILKIIASNVSTISESIDVSDVYRSALTNHFIGFTKLQYNDTSPDGARSYREFERLGATAYNNLVQANTPSEARIGQNV